MIKNRIGSSILNRLKHNHKFNFEIKFMNNKIN